ncbi:alpha/beta hydrolase-fold protein [Roseisolibacter sp. H3M3-2]|uniref:alpha/beta hydrolase n=1 Tax=Roseisolibacter sp. H3M3-2 TaxID=3031323 RepID=UPI0023DA981C|nr:alpha/beta hydrolase-fold protein [Roseisolibacter sp. H3M3-2]MDF1505929.1 alpha/beta hydrolase-fold protein [Roseisolibacter sp. H3M3-2]
MRRAALALLGLLGIAAAAAPAAAQRPALSDSLVVDSRALGEARRLNVHLPDGYAAAGAARYPLLVMPDGGMDEDFPHVVATVDSLVALGRMRPVVVVGIPNTQRRRDLTGPTRVKEDSAIAPRVGGSAAFRAFVRDELLPAVSARWRVTDERGIIGESLAGLFVVETFLLEPTLFRHAIALDPSLWWDRRSLVDSAAVAARVRAAGAAPRTLTLASSGTREIAEPTARLAALLRGAPGLSATYEARPDLTHATIFRAVKPAALVRAFR